MTRKKALTLAQSRIVEAYLECGRSPTRAARRLAMNRSYVEQVLSWLRQLGLVPTMHAAPPLQHPKGCPECGAEPGVATAPFCEGCGDAMRLLAL